jgi:hypothetical protein
MLGRLDIWYGGRAKTVGREQPRSHLNNPRGVVWWVATAFFFEVARQRLGFLPCDFILCASLLHFCFLIEIPV